MPDKAIEYSGTTLIALWKFVPAGDPFLRLGVATRAAASTRVLEYYSSNKLLE